MIDASGLQPRHVRAGTLARVPMHVKYALEASEDTFRPAGAKIAQAAPAQATQIALATPGPAEVAPLDEAISGAVPIEASIAGGTPGQLDLRHRRRGRAARTGPFQGRRAAKRPDLR